MEEEGKDSRGGTNTVRQGQTDVPGGETACPDVPSRQEHSLLSAVGTEKVG